jgi:hypothetical protein
LPALRSLPDIHQHRHYRTSINWLLPEVIGIASTALPDIHRLVITGGYGHYRASISCRQINGITWHPLTNASSRALRDIHQLLHKHYRKRGHYRASINCRQINGITWHPSTNASSSICLLKLVGWMIEDYGKHLLRYRFVSIAAIHCSH